MAFQSESRETAVSAFLYKNAVAQNEARVAGLQLISSRFIPEVTAHEIYWCDADGDVHHDVVIFRLSDYDVGLYCAFLEGKQPLPSDFSVHKITKVGRDMYQVIVVAYGMMYAFDWLKGAMKFPKALTRNQCLKIDAHLRLGSKSPLPENMGLHSATEIVAGKANALRVGIAVEDGMHLFTWLKELGCFASYSMRHERYFHSLGSGQ
jgi:hypothetical protein